MRRIDRFPRNSTVVMRLSKHLNRKESLLGIGSEAIGDRRQWTEEFTDDHTHAAILRGGEYYQPQGSTWYFPLTYQLNEHGKLLLTAPSLDRSGGVGFRCVQDAE